MPHESDYLSNMRTDLLNRRKQQRFPKILVGVLVLVVLVVAIGLAIGLSLSIEDGRHFATYQEQTQYFLSHIQLMDGHNDIAMKYRAYSKNKVYMVDLQKDTRPIWKNSQTDIPRLRKGKVGAQFWSAFVVCNSQYKDALHLTLDQIDVIKKFIKKYPDVFEFVTTSNGIHEVFSKHRIGSLIGVEGGHSIDNSLAVLRMFYDLGVRYMTLTHDCSTPWADGWLVDKPDYQGNKLGGLSSFGKVVVKEMNRLGMMVDLSHVAKQTMIAAIEVSKAPVMFSHSSAFAMCNHFRNVQDDVLQMVKTNRGVVMVNFNDVFINCPPHRQENATLGQVAGEFNPLPNTADHIEYIKNLIGVDHVGLGSDYDGVPTMPQGLEDVSTFPALIEELFRRGWNDDELTQFVGGNLLRVFRTVEEVRDSLKNEPPHEDLILPEDIPNLACRTDF